MEHGFLHKLPPELNKLITEYAAKTKIDVKLAQEAGRVDINIEIGVVAGEIIQLNFAVWLNHIESFLNQPPDKNHGTITATKKGDDGFYNPHYVIYNMKDRISIVSGDDVFSISLSPEKSQELINKLKVIIQK